MYTWLVFSLLGLAVAWFSVRAARRMSGRRRSGKGFLGVDFDSYKLREQRMRSLGQDFGSY